MPSLNTLNILQKHRIWKQATTITAQIIKLYYFLYSNILSGIISNSKVAHKTTRGECPSCNIMLAEKEVENMTSKVNSGAKLAAEIYRRSKRVGIDVRNFVGKGYGLS